MTFKKQLLAILTSFLLAGTTTSTFAMWGTAADEDNEQTKQAVIQRQLKELEPLGAKLLDKRSFLGESWPNRDYLYEEEILELIVSHENHARLLETSLLVIPLTGDNPVRLADKLRDSSELLDHYSIYLFCDTSLSADHLPIFNSLKKYVLGYNKPLDVTTGTILCKVLSQNPKLTGLLFDHNSITDDGLITIQQSISTLSNLQYLGLECVEFFGNNAISTFFNILPTLISLKDLSFKGTGIGSSQENNLSTALSQLIHLESIDLSGNDLTGDFLKALEHMSTLTSLNISFNPIKNEKFRLFAIDQCPLRKSLTMLNMRYIELDNEGLFYISKLSKLASLAVKISSTVDDLSELADLQNLMFLDLSFSKLKGDCLYALKSLSRLRLLKLEDNQVTGKNLRILLKSQFTNCLQILTLSGNPIDPEGVRYISLFPNLLQIDLNNLKITDEDTKCLATGNLINLKELMLNDNQITDEGTKYLVIGNLPNLKILHLRNNKITYRGAEYLATATNFHTLDLTNNNIGDDGAQALAQNMTLRSLCLGKNNIGDRGVQALARNTTLKSLNLVANPINKAGSAALSLRNSSTMKVEF